MRGNQVISGCPHCGGTVNLLDGTFDVVDGRFRVLSAPQWSVDLLRELRLALEQATTDPMEDPIAHVGSVSPEFAGRLRRITRGWTRDQKLNLLTVLFAALAFFGVDAGDVTDAAREAMEKIESLLEQAERDGPPSPPASPEPDSPTPPSGE